jgi:hypothetical protein
MNYGNANVRLPDHAMSQHIRLFCSERVRSVLLKVAPFRLNLAQYRILVQGLQNSSYWLTHTQWHTVESVSLSHSHILAHSTVSTQPAAISLSSGLPTNDRSGKGSGGQAQDANCEHSATISEQCGICGGQSDTGTECSPNTPAVPCQYHSTSAPNIFGHLLAMLYISSKSQPRYIAHLKQKVRK